MALNADETQSEVSWAAHCEDRLRLGAAFLVAVAGSVFLWVLLILMGMLLLRLTGYR
jgi:hypothetical protein